MQFGGKGEIRAGKGVADEMVEVRGSDVKGEKINEYDLRRLIIQTGLALMFLQVNIQNL